MKRLLLCEVFAMVVEATFRIAISPEPARFGTQFRNYTFTLRIAWMTIVAFRVERTRPSQVVETNIHCWVEGVECLGWTLGMFVKATFTVTSRSISAHNFHLRFRIGFKGHRLSD
jgi:hypothetical protein